MHTLPLMVQVSLLLAYHLHHQNQSERKCLSKICQICWSASHLCGFLFSLINNINDFCPFQKQTPYHVSAESKLWDVHQICESWGDVKIFLWQGTWVSLPYSAPTLDMYHNYTLVIHSTSLHISVSESASY